jgi:hypothetical protein
LGYFEQLNTAWQKRLNAIIKDVLGDQYPDIAAAFREDEARYLGEVEIPAKPTKKWADEVQDELVNFFDGWKAATEAFAKDNKVAIASWVREHGEYTDYSDLENNDYPAYIVKESDLNDTKRTS